MFLLHGTPLLFFFRIRYDRRAPRRSFPLIYHRFTENQTVGEKIVEDISLPAPADRGPAKKTPSSLDFSGKRWYIKAIFVRLRPLRGRRGGFARGTFPAPPVYEIKMNGPSAGTESRDMAKVFRTSASPAVQRRSAGSFPVPDGSFAASGATVPCPPVFSASATAASVSLPIEIECRRAFRSC